MISIHDVERHLEQGNTLALCHALGDRNVLIRRRAAQALGELGHADGVAALTAALQRDKDQYVIRWSVGALQAIGNPAAVEALTAAAFGERRDAAVLAAQALAAIHIPQAEAAYRIREMLQRNTFDGFTDLGEESKSALIAVMNSRQFKAWPSGKRRPVLMAAVRLGIAPPAHYRRDLIDMGLFVSGLHTVGDLLAGLGHTSALVRASAAEKLGETGLSWTRFLLAQRFEKEMRHGGDRQVAVAVARALAKMGDDQGISHYQKKLAGKDMYQSADAVRAISDIGTPQAIRILFEASLEPHAPAGFHNTSQILSELETIGPVVVDTLREIAESDNPAARQRLAQVVGRSGHADALTILKRLCTDPDHQVQQAAFDALARLNSPEAAQTLFDLKGELPTQIIIASLAQFTNAEAITYLRALSPEMTALHGVALNDDSTPLSGGYAQLMQERFVDEAQAWEWVAISTRAKTSDTGEFWLAIPEHEDGSPARIKITTVPHGDGTPSETFITEVGLRWGKIHHVKARIDRFVARLVVDIRVQWLAE
jgi:HEAT repeat protein